MALSEPLGHSDPERHRIPGLQKQVQLCNLLREGDKHRPLGRAYLQQEPIRLALLSQDLAFNPCPLTAHRLGQVGGDEGRAHGRHADTEDDPRQECQGENQ